MTTDTEEAPTKIQTLADLKPDWAVCLIVAALEQDKSDSMSDYFNTDISTIVPLAWSRHKRDLFAEMRQAAAQFEKTKHLGPGCNVFRVKVVTAQGFNDNGRYYGENEASPWHGELFDGDEEARYGGKRFCTRADAEIWMAGQPAPGPIEFQGAGVIQFRWHVSETSIEHREKYSMGSGYYLKGSGHYSDGWKVYKTYIPDHADRITKWDLGILLASRSRRRQEPQPEPQPVTTATMSFNAEKNGVELRFPTKPALSVLESLKSHGWRWARFTSCWYHKDSPDTRAFAQQLAGGQ